MTKDVSFQSMIEDDPYTSRVQKNSFESICCQTPFQAFSYEELRLADYHNGEKSEHSALWVFDQWMRLVPSTSDVYFSSEEEFGVKELFKLQTESLVPGLSAVSLLNSSYFTSAPEKQTLVDSTWESWLQHQLGILREPRLVDPGDPANLSKLFTLLATDQPDKFLGTLQRYWKSYEWIVNPEITKAISSVKVPCTSGKKKKLRSTFLPLPKSLADVFLRDNETLPFLELHPLLTADEWKFLTKFGAQKNDDLKFYFALLKCIRKWNDDGEVLVDPDRVFKVYEAIYTKYWSSSTKIIDQERIW